MQRLWEVCEFDKVLDEVSGVLAWSLKKCSWDPEVVFMAQLLGKWPSIHLTSIRGAPTIC